MRIRLAESRDIPVLLKLLRQILYVHHVGRPDLFRAAGEKYRAEELEAILCDASRPIFVAVENDAVVGYAFCVFQQHVNNNILTDIKTLYIDDLCVLENCRGKHIGSAIYQKILEYAKYRGCYNVTLNVWACNPGALKFYEKCGMQVQKMGMEWVL